ncbi:charged multivesicular body protein 6-A [Anthonomus grandis grandis]|uniref:charged multivesicular body protein 6-A n=1 Tax=Anthonomus grandis grandis TaxID=2921223 RepID=UPI0021668570|nr:charged multivesicular body protein 6-A [Anthonomus grandis grandis]
MGVLFSKKKPSSRITPHDKAVLQLKQQRDKLKQYQKRIEKQMENDRELARKLLNAGHKDRALLLLKKKRYQEKLLTKADGQLSTLETLTQDLEFAEVEQKVLEGLKQGNEALKKITDSMNIEEIERILDETKEAKEKQDEISNLLGGSLSEEDLESVEEEYAKILEEEMPEVPVDEVIGDGLTEEEETPVKPVKAKKSPKKTEDRVALEA